MAEEKKTTKKSTETTKESKKTGSESTTKKSTASKTASTKKSSVEEKTAPTTKKATTSTKSSSTTKASSAKKPTSTTKKSSTTKTEENAKKETTKKNTNTTKKTSDTKPLTTKSPKKEISLETEIEKAERERKKKVSSFHLNMDLDSEYGEYKNVDSTEVKEEVKEFTDISSGNKDEKVLQDEKDIKDTRDGKKVITAESFNPFSEDAEDGMLYDEQDPNAPVRLTDEEEEYANEDKVASKGERKATSCLSGLLYVVCVLAVSCVLAFFILTAILDMVGINKSAEQVDIQIPKGASTQQIAEILHDNDLISHPLFFRLFSKFTHSDGTYQSGVFTVAAKEGYQGLITALQNEGERESVDVTIPEGLTVKEIASLLEESGVCSAADFLTEIEQGDFSDYDFVKQVPKIGEGTDHPYRIYRLEGYLFPDTYTFYLECAPETVICKFFDNFEIKLDTKLRSAIKAAGMTIDEAVTLASVVQKEADNPTDMSKVSRVFQNRLGDLEDYPYLQSDVTTEYAGKFIPDIKQDNDTFKAYSTYDCKGLPTGPICNPGIAALNAVANPCSDEDIVDCYYFATDLEADPKVTYYSETYSEHMAICEKYGIGVHG